MKMNSFLTIVSSMFLAFLISFPAHSLAQQSRFDEANRLLEENRFEEALPLYKSIEEEGYHSGALWLNIGIVYTQMDSLGMAKYYLLRAAGPLETREFALQALDYVNERFPRRSALLPELPWNRFFTFLSERFGIATLVVIALLLLNLAAALLIGSWFRYDLRKLFRLTSFSLFAFSVLFFFFSLIIHYQETRFSTGIVTDRQSAVYQLPEESAAQITTAFEGFSLRVDHKLSEEAEGWHYVRLENGMFGWIRNEGIRVL